MNPRYDLLIAGEINPDMILYDSKLEPRFGQVEVLVENAALTIGSSSVIMACGAARLGLRVAMIGVVGKDTFGDFMLEAMRQRGVDVSPVIIDPALKTGVTVILSRGADRAILTYPGAIDALSAEMLTDDLLRRARHFHLSSYYLQTRLQPGVPDLFRRARRLGLTTSLDTNWDPSESWLGLPELLPLTDLFLPNVNEARAISQATALPAAMQYLSSQAGIAAVKMGEQGGAAQQGQLSLQVPALPVNVVDTVGAGDSFDAGFVYGFLNAWELGESLKLAVVCGSLSTQGEGGVVAQPGLDEARAAMQALTCHPLEPDHA